jgi:hypothetical protein
MTGYEIMSVNLDSIEATPAVSESVCNATWAAVVACARQYEPDKVPAWNGYHDGQVWTSEQLKIMADRLEQTASVIPILRELAQHGGVKIS